MKIQKKSTQIIIGVILGVLLFLAVAKLTGVHDLIKSAFFTPSAEIASIIDDLKLTDKGNVIIRATRPALEDSSAFNQNCDSHDDEVYVLGCYDSKSDLLHLYNIQTDELPGMLEATTAHEMLHAVWSRLPIWDQISLSSELLQVFNSLPSDSDIRDSMELYGKNEFYDELHSRLGTELADLPDSLESHYAKYFQDQDAIVAFHTAYDEKYQSIIDELSALEEEINALNDELSAEITHYDSWSEELNNKIVQFNASVDDLSETDYYTERAALSAEIDQIDNFYDALVAKVDRYNSLIDSYNTSANRQLLLLDSINSNAHSLTEKADSTTFNFDNLLNSLTGN